MELRLTEPMGKGEVFRHNHAGKLAGRIFYSLRSHYNSAEEQGGKSLLDCKQGILQSLAADVLTWIYSPLSFLSLSLSPPNHFSLSQNQSLKPQVQQEGNRGGPLARRQGRSG